MKDKNLRNMLLLAAISLIALLVPALLIELRVIDPYSAQILP